jgi:hypothetical protein
MLTSYSLRARQLRLHQLSIWILKSVVGFCFGSTYFDTFLLHHPYALENIVDLNLVDKASVCVP